VPIQFHVGYGDTDADMLTANPLHLRAVFEQPAYRSMPIVLLHECYPYTREGAYLATVYGNAYLDLSYGIPFVGSGETAAFTRAVFGIAPYSKLGMPEFHWLSARQGRRIVGEVLGEIVAQGDLSLREAEAAGEDVLRRNALRLYRIGSA
jgi:predicted TIM-barrel fold metal-dependent hydrolase